MTRVHVVTSFSPQGFEDYGKVFLRTYAEHWGAPLYVVVEDSVGDVNDWVKANTEIKHLALDKLNDRPLIDNCWKEDYQKGSRQNRSAYMKWGKKVLAIKQAAETVDTRWLIWIDADVEFIAPVTASWLKHEILNSEADVCTLLRDKNPPDIPTWPETGFVAFRMKSPAARAIIEDWAGWYESGDVFMLKKWEDAYVFGVVLKNCTGARVHDLNRSVLTSHPWRNSKLAECMTHYKGPRRKTERYGRHDPLHPSKIEN